MLISPMFMNFPNPHFSSPCFAAEERPAAAHEGCLQVGHRCLRHPGQGEDLGTHQRARRQGDHRGDPGRLSPTVGDPR